MRRASIGLIAATAALVFALVTATLSIVAVTRNHAQTVTLSSSAAPDKRTVAVAAPAAGSAAPTTPIQSGETSVTVMVNVTYSLQ